MKLRSVLIFNIFSIITAFNTNYAENTQLTYKPFGISSEINLQIALYDLNPSFGIQWWVSDNLQLSGTISPRIKNEFNLYNNFSLGYYNENIRWLYSSSNFIEISLHKIKYSDNYSSRWINCSYKSRYKYKNFISGYDINYYFWKNIEDNFISLVIGYDIKEKATLELKTHLINNMLYFNSFNFSIPL